MRTKGYSVAKSKILFIRFSYLFGSVLTVLLKIRYLKLFYGIFVYYSLLKFRLNTIFCQFFKSSCIFSCAVASTGRPGLCLFSKPTYPLFKFVSPSVNCSFRKSIFTTNTFQGIQYFNSFSISVVLDFYIRSLFNGSERGHCASNTSARRDVTIDDVIIRTPDVMCEWLTRRTRYIPNFICLACKLIAL